MNASLVEVVLELAESAEKRVVRVSVSDSGAGAWSLVCIHGFGDNLHTWQELRSALAERGARVLAFDLPGFGATPLDPWFQGAYLARTLALTRALARARLPAGRPLLAVGNSLGGAVALAWAAGAVRGEPAPDATLLLAPATPFSRVPLFAELTRTPVYPLSEGLRARLPASGRRAVARLIARAALGSVLAPTARAPRAWRDALVDSFARPGALLDLESIARELLWILRGKDSSARELVRGVEELDAPLLVLRGELDPVIGAAECLELARRIRGARYRALPGIGHCPQNEASALCAEACLELLDAVRAREANALAREPFGGGPS